MAETGHRGFDRTVQETNTWLHEISDEMEDPRSSVAYHALRGVLFALRDRLPPDEVFDLSAQLPLLVRGLFFEGYSSKGKPEKYSHDEFLQRVRDELQTVGGANTDRAVRAVLTVLSRHIGEGEIRDVCGDLPADLRRLWPADVAE